MQNSIAQYLRLLSPSWLSGVISVIASLLVVVGTVIVSSYQGSGLHQDILQAQHSGVSLFNFNQQTVTSGLAQNSLVGNLPLFLFWAALGVIVYLSATSIWRALSSAEELREEMDYVNAPKSKLLSTAAINLLVRLIALVAWLLYLQFFLKVLLPYVLAAARVEASNLASFSGISYAVLAIMVFALAIHIHVIFWRLIWLRVRLFG